MGVMTAREFYLHTAKAVARAAAGETISVTKHGRPVARLMPDSVHVDTSLGVPPARGTPEWQVAHDGMMQSMKDNSFSWGGRVTYADKHE